MTAAVDRADAMEHVPRPADDLGVQLSREWLLTNGRGGYASGTVVGIPTRRYHGLLIASARPPLDRWLLLAGVLERVTIDGKTHELAGFEFEKAIHPKGYRFQTAFETRNRPQGSWARFEYEADGMRMSKRVVLDHEHDGVWIAYRIDGPADAAIGFELAPFVAMRDFHATTHAFASGFPVHQICGRVAVESYPGGPRLWMGMERADRAEAAAFEGRADWWYGFVYREELHRGFDDREDLFVPGWFKTSGQGAVEVVFRADADFSGGPVAQRPPARSTCLPAMPAAGQTIDDRLLEAADACVVRRRRADGSDSTTILAGYHWFGDWGRDAFIALPGLLLETRRFGEARQVLETFASAQRDGLIPNRFSDYGDGCDYNSVDASLWYLHGAVRYLEASGDRAAWREFLAATCGQIVDSFVKGTQFNIHVDTDGLVICGDATTQLTWMDAKFGDVVFTPRHGKPVEINALWYHGLLALASHVEQDDPQQAAKYRSLARRAGESFAPNFWNPAGRCLYDVIRNDERDATIRPNQVFAVSLPHSPLSESQQRAVLSCVESELFTPYGLRSLSPRDGRYRGRYEGGPFDRDGAYHQGTVWGWLMGPYIEAYLRVQGFSRESRARARRMLMPLIRHLDEAGIGSVSEIFDGDPPHTPRGCIAQAWSVGELLRAWRLTEADERG